MSPSSWGPSTWIFMHTLTVKIKEDQFSIIAPRLIHQLIQICNHLPCPECAQHARHFWTKVNPAGIKTKQDLIHLIFMFHNMVNQRKRMPLFKYENMEQYKDMNLINTYNNFIRNFNTRGNMNLISEAFHRNLMLSNLKKWLMSHLVYFNM
jgi:hypothetical protein